MEVPNWLFLSMSGMVALGGMFGLSIMAKGRKWLEAKIENQWLEKLALIVWDSVAELGPAVKKLKEAAADGKLTDAEINEIKAMAWNAVKRRMGAGELLDRFGSEEAAKDVVMAKVENAVALQKK